MNRIAWSEVFAGVFFLALFACLFYVLPWFLYLTHGATL